MGFLENLEAAFDMPSWDYVDPKTGDAFRVIRKAGYFPSIWLDDDFKGNITPFLGESR